MKGELVLSNENKLDLILQHLQRVTIHPDIMDISAAANFLHKSKSTIRNYIAQDIIPYHKKAGSIYLYKQELIDWVLSG